MADGLCQAMEMVGFEVRLVKIFKNSQLPCFGNNCLINDCFFPLLAASQQSFLYQFEIGLIVQSLDFKWVVLRLILSLGGSI